MEQQSEQHNTKRAKKGVWLCRWMEQARSQHNVKGVRDSLVVVDGARSELHNMKMVKKEERSEEEQVLDGARK